jgi:hypothetical protein
MIRIFVSLLLLWLPARAAPPGVVVHHSPAASGRYIGSPSLCVLDDGSYLASHDYFGPESREHERASGRLYRSKDRGASWQPVADFEGFFWQNLFVHLGTAYALGLDKHHGQVIIRKSTDGGSTWTDPAILAPGLWHTAPMPILEHNGRLWRAIEDATNGSKWGERYQARMMSAPAESDLLDPNSWTLSNPLARDPTWLAGDFAAWLEGNAVVDPAGNLVNLLRVDGLRLPEKAAIVRVSADGTTSTFDASADFIDFPGGAKKFTIRKDPAGPGYWSLASVIVDRHAGAGRPATIRNTLALTHSNDLRHWTIRSVLLHHPDVAKHGFQYVDWQYDGDDLIALCRTAWDDDFGGARNNHDANFLTFHRWEKFRSLTREDDMEVPQPALISRETPTLTLRGEAYDIAPLMDGEKAFLNRNYTWQEIPARLAGSAFTRLGVDQRGYLEVFAKSDTTLQMATLPDPKRIDLSGWEATGDGFVFDDEKRTQVTLFQRSLRNGETLPLPRGNWTGAILIIPPTAP